MTPDDLRARFRATPARDVPTSALRRLWKTGRGAMGAAGALLGRRGDDDGAGPDDADLAKIAGLATQLGELKGIAMKAGQILGYVDASLPPEVRGLLALLQTQAPASPWPVVEATVREALGDRADALLAGLDREPIAVASIGQVHHGRLPDGTEVAVKVRHRGIEAAMRADFRAARIGPVMATLFGAGGAVRGMIDEARQAFLEECDLGLEADRQDELRRLFAGHPTIVIPEVVRAYSATAVLTTRWLPGRTLDAFLAAAPSQAARDRAGVALFELYVATLYRHGVFHADPHPGNYAFRDDGKVVIYDFGCVRRFEPEMVAALAALVAAVRADDAAAIADAMRGLGATPPRGDAAVAHLRGLLRAFFAPLLVDGARAVEPGAGLAGADVLRDKRAIMKLGLPGRVLFLFRLRFGLYAVLARLGAVADWAGLERGWAAAGGLRAA